jgi:hypothetical protein
VELVFFFQTVNAVRIIPMMAKEMSNVGKEVMGMVWNVVNVVNVVNVWNPG